jgi:ABC-type multidrug transport system fused ATPase/permease subunit
VQFNLYLYYIAPTMLTATSSIDYETDSIIQSYLRSELGSDVTVLTVAHRLQTVMDADKIVRYLS